jgi:hypothetical protein
MPIAPPPHSGSKAKPRERFGMSKRFGIIYLLHFETRYKHAGHYLGYVDSDLDRRLIAHERGFGANLMRVIRNAGINFALARTWNGDRARERRLKKQGGASRFCPLCKQHLARIDHRDRSACS